MQDLTISVVQSSLSWESPRENFASFDEQLKSTPNNCDLIVLPEMFTTGFTMQVDRCAEKMGGPTCQWLTEKAKRYSAVVTGSAIIKEGQNFFNRLLWAKADGSIDFYDKRHLFTLAKEEQTFTAGQVRKVFELGGWRVLPQICYDLRFPVFSRNTNDYDLAVYVANWPDTRQTAWETLLRARAIENQAYVVGVNRIGKDPKGLRYAGGSKVFGPSGGELLSFQENTRCECATLSYGELISFREDFPFLRDRDLFDIGAPQSSQRGRDRERRREQ